MTSPPIDYAAAERLRADLQGFADAHEHGSLRVGMDEVRLVLALLADNARMREVLEEREAARSQPGAACPSDCAENGPPRSDGEGDA